MSKSERKLSDRYTAVIFNQFVDKIVDKFGKKATAGLTAYDFPCNEMLCIKFEDDSEMRFNYAFVVEGDEFYGVFTEHCGYHLVYKKSVARMWIRKETSRGTKITYLKNERD